MKSLYLRQWEVKHFLTLAPGESMQVRRPISWKPYHDGEKVNFAFSGMEAGNYCTGTPESGWVLYSRGASSCWNQRTKVEQPPLSPGQVFEGRETWCYFPPNATDGMGEMYYYNAEQTGSRRANEIMEINGVKWRSPITMPPAAVRIYGLCKAVKCERVRGITEADAVKMGCEGVRCPHDGGSVLGCTDCMNTGWLEPATLAAFEHWQADYPEFPFDSAWCWVYDVERMRP